MKELEDAWYSAQPMRAECWLCEWTVEGTTQEVLRAQKAHRLEHGVPKRRNRRSARSLTRFKQSTLSEDDLDEIELERRRRAFLTGVEIED